MTVSPSPGRCFLVTGAAGFRHPRPAAAPHHRLPAVAHGGSRVGAEASDIGSNPLALKYEVRLPSRRTST